MAVTDTIEINGEEREIADAYAREQCAANAKNIATNAEGIANLNSNLDEYGTPSLRVENVSVSSAALAISEPFHANANENITLYIEMSGSGYYSVTKESGISIENGGTIESCENGRLYNFALSSEIYAIGLYVNAPCTIRKFILFKGNNIIRNISNSVGLLNESLGDYGLSNVLEGLVQGYWSDDFVLINSNFDITIRYPKTCNVGDRITLKIPNYTGIELYFKFFDSSNILLQKTIIDAKYENIVVAPENAVKFSFAFAKKGITPENVGHVGLYINSAIDELKNDLSAVQSNTILNYESTTVDLNSLTGHPLIASVNTGATNAPTGFGGGYMIVVYAGSSSAALYQTLVDVVNNKRYRRSLYHGSWSDWSLTAQ